MKRSIIWIGKVVTRENRNPGASMTIALLAWLDGWDFPNGQQMSKKPTGLVHK